MENKLSIEEFILSFCNFLNFKEDQIMNFEFDIKYYEKLKKDLGCMLDERIDSSGYYINIYTPKGLVRIYKADDE